MLLKLTQKEEEEMKSDIPIDSPANNLNQTVR